MDQIVDDAGRKLAQRIRIERDARNWSLAELAERAGVAKGAISKIERGETSPIATTLVRLAGAFDLTLAGLLLRAEAAPDGVSRAADQPLWRDPATGYLRRQVFMRPEHPVELVEVEMPPGGRVEMPASSYARIRQVVWVLAGEMTLILGERTHTLSAGDSLGFGPPTEVVFENRGTEPARYLVALART